MCDNYDIKVMLSGTNYHIASIGVNEEKQEIFYSPKIVSNTIGCDLNRNQMAGSIDHFSLHKDGRVHGTFKAFNRDKKNKNKLPLYLELDKFEGGIIPSSSDIMGLSNILCK